MHASLSVQRRDTWAPGGKSTTLTKSSQTTSVGILLQRTQKRVMVLPTACVDILLCLLFRA